MRVPFAAPPTERDRKRLWIGLGVGGAALLLCCVGGLVGFGALAVIGQRTLPSQARTVVGDFLDRLSQQEWGEAYDLLCQPRRRSEGLAAFTDRQQQYPQIDSYAVATPAQKTAPFVVTAQVRDRDGDEEDERYQVVAESGQLKVCLGTR